MSPGDRGAHFEVLHMRHPIGSHIKHQPAGYVSPQFREESTAPQMVYTRTYTSRGHYTCLAHPDGPLELHPLAGGALSITGWYQHIAA